ncbi:MAG: DNA polymerase III subunit alpha [Propionibacteriaceae bacterium]|nr:DNA polymerase III subunit alpha [Propionibacteriaceae bacterium]
MSSFAHLRVASGYSFQYGASRPGELVKRAGELGMDTLAITDRGGLYGAVRFVKHCREAGIWPVIGVDLALGQPGDTAKRPAPVRGGSSKDLRRPRLVVLAAPGDGWSALCRLTTAAHVGREEANVTAETLAAHVAGRDAAVLLGADSDVGLLLAADSYDAARRSALEWREAVGDGLVLAATNHRIGGRGVASASQAAGLMKLAVDLELPCVITNMVRMAYRHQAPTLDVLDAARRLVPLNARNLDRRNAEGYLKDGEAMAYAAEEAARLAGVAVAGVLTATRDLAERTRLHPVRDIGLGDTRLPEFEVLGVSGHEALRALRQRCEAGAAARYGNVSERVSQRLDEELETVKTLGFESYFLTVAEIVALIRDRGIRCTARGSGVGSLVNYVLGISGVDPVAHNLIMARFLSPERRALPDIDLDVESARRAEVYDLILETFGSSRVGCVAMLETYRVRHAVRAVGAALSLPPTEIDAMAKAFPHIRARDARAALRDLPELRAAGLGEKRLDGLFRLVESLDGLPRHVALHPSGVLLSDSTLRDHTPVEPSAIGYPMSQFDKEDVEDLGFLKLDVLGIRMQSAIAHALTEIERTEGSAPDIDELDPYDDAGVYDMIGRRQTLGCFQIESPGQRELVGKFGPSSFADLIIDISLYRPGPVKTDMITPFLEVRQGWCEPQYLHERFMPILEETSGVVVFHEQIIQLIAFATGCSLGQGDEVRRVLGDPAGQAQLKPWLISKALESGLSRPVVEELWEILVGFASFGFCKAHAASFALPTYQSSWLKHHHPAAFLAGVLTHDPGMYPKRLLLEEARRLDIAVLGMDINVSDTTYRVERVAGAPSGWGIRLSLADVKGISEAELASIVAARPFRDLTDFFHRAAVTHPVAEHLVLTGAFDALYDICPGDQVRRRPQVTRRDLLLRLGDLHRLGGAETCVGAQQAFGFAEEEEIIPSGLPEFTSQERLQAELEILGLDASEHIMERYLPMLAALGVVPAQKLLVQRNRSEVLVAGVKVATQTPPVRSGRRVIFLTVDDSTGPVDATFFEDVQGPYAATVFDSWLLLVRGTIQRAGLRGVSVRATGAWDLARLFELWEQTRQADGHEAARQAVLGILAEVPEGYSLVREYTLPTELLPPDGDEPPPDPQQPRRSGGMGRRRTPAHASRAEVSPYSDVKPAGIGAAEAPRKLWHSSLGSSGR